MTFIPIAICMLIYYNRMLFLFLRNFKKKILITKLLSGGGLSLLERKLFQNARTKDFIKLFDRLKNLLNSCFYYF